MLLKSMPLADIAQDSYGPPVVRVTAPIVLSRAELVAALYRGFAPEADPWAADGRQVNEALMLALMHDGMSEIQLEAGALAQRPPTDAAASRFLAACGMWADRLLTEARVPAAPMSGPLPAPPTPSAVAAQSAAVVR